MDRLPLPNSVRCPALDLFRKYNYPDDHTVKQFKEAVVVEAIEKIIAVSKNEAGSVQQATGGEVIKHQGANE